MKISNTYQNGQDQALSTIGINPDLMSKEAKLGLLNMIGKGLRIGAKKVGRGVNRFFNKAYQGKINAARNSANRRNPGLNLSIDKSPGVISSIGKSISQTPNRAMSSMSSRLDKLAPNAGPRVSSSLPSKNMPRPQSNMRVTRQVNPQKRPAIQNPNNQGRTWTRPNPQQTQQANAARQQQAQQVRADRARKNNLKKKYLAEQRRNPQAGAQQSGFKSPEEFARQQAMAANKQKTTALKQRLQQKYNTTSGTKSGTTSGTTSGTQQGPEAIAAARQKNIETMRRRAKDNDLLNFNTTKQGVNVVDDAAGAAAKTVDDVAAPLTHQQRTWNWMKENPILTGVGGLGAYGLLSRGGGGNQPIVVTNK